MNASMPPEQRRDIILSRLTTRDRVVARALAQEFGVSEDAVRRDLRELADAGKCRRIYGGALPPAEAVPFVERVDRDFPSKRALARTALRFIVSGQTIYLDAGSTNLALAESLPRGLSLNVVTNSVAIARTLHRRPGIDLFLIGGRVDPKLDGAVGASAIEQIGSYRPDLCFIGTCALDAGYGATAVDDRDAELKRAAVKAGNRVVVLATNEKLGTTAPHRIASLAELDCLIVEGNAPPDRCASFAAAGVDLLRAEKPHDLMPRGADRTDDP